MYDAKICFIARMKWFYHHSLLKCFFYFFASSLVSYFVKKTACTGRFRIFFYLHAIEQGKTRSSCDWQPTFPPWPRGKSNCLKDPPKSSDFDFGWFADRSSPTEVGWGFNSHSLSWPDLSLNHPKLKSKLGVVCAKTLGSTAGPRRQTLMPKVFN